MNSLPAVLTVLFVLFKVFDVVDWSWWVVFAPVLVQVGFFMMIAILILGLGTLAAIWKK